MIEQMQAGLDAREHQLEVLQGDLFIERDEKHKLASEFEHWRRHRTRDIEVRERVIPYDTMTMAMTPSPKAEAELLYKPGGPFTYEEFHQHNQAYTLRCSRVMVQFVYDVAHGVPDPMAVRDRLADLLRNSDVLLKEIDDQVRLGVARRR